MPGVLKLPALLGGTAERPVAVVAQIVTFVVCLAFVVIAVRSFIEARRSRVGRQPRETARMPLAVRLTKQGGPEVMVLEEVPVPPPGPGEATLRHTAIGLNFIDVYQRNGHYPLQLPSGLGQEAAGVVTAVGAGVTAVQVGDRVAYAGAPLGAYSEARNFPAERLVPVPEGVSDEAAAASLLKGLTAWYLVRRTFRVERGQTVLVHAAAGGVGLILCQWLRHLGATVIGTVGSEAKAELAQEAGLHPPAGPRREQPARAPGEGEGAHRRREGAGGVRLDRQGHLRRLAGVPGAVRADGALRRLERSGALRSTCSGSRPAARST